MKADKIGALWSNDRPNAPLLKGSIEIRDENLRNDVARQIAAGEKVRIVIWRNKWKKEGTRDPDATIEIDTYVPGQNQVSPASGYQAQTTPKMQDEMRPVNDGNAPTKFDDAVPFDDDFPGF